MLPLLGVVGNLFPHIVEQLGAPFREQSGSLQDQVLKAIKKATGLPNPETLDPKVVEAEMTKPAANTQLDKDLQQIALDELKERDRTKEEAQRIESSAIAWTPKRTSAFKRRKFSAKCSTSRIGRSRARRK